MNVDFSKVLVEIDGQECEYPVYETKVEEKTKEIVKMLPLTLALACGMALNNDSDKPNSEEKFKRGKLSYKITMAKDKVSLNSELISLLKERAGATFGSSVVFQIHNLLEGKEQFSIED